MSLADAKRALRWDVVMAALAAAGVDVETVDMVTNARSAHEVTQSLTAMLLGGTDAKAARNYVKVEMVGLIAPFERMYIEFVRPGGKTSHELREMLRARLEHVLHALRDPSIKMDAFREGLEMAVRETLDEEAP